MKKNISINISGIIFHIEEDGYEKLKNYLESINRYFSTFDDSHEIIADIESRIAEIFLGKLKDGKQVITLEDVNSLVATMGSIEDFQAAEEDMVSTIEPGFSGRERYNSRTENEYSYSSAQNRKTLYRDTKHKILGGVLAGLSHYFHLDPIWGRLFYLLLFFGISFLPQIGGALLILYLVLWVIMPPNDDLSQETKMRKMFRDPERKVVAGVCEGVAAYFGIEAFLVRLLFFLFIFLGGTGAILYIILWIILPEAKSITDRMQMQGEPVTLKNIEDNIRRSFNVKDGHEANLVKVILFPFRLVGQLIDFLHKLLVPFVKFMMDLLRIVLAFTFIAVGLLCVIVLVFLYGSFIGIGNAQDYFHLDGVPMWVFFNDINFINGLSSFFVLLVPIVWIALLGFILFMKKPVINATVAWFMAGVWALSTIVAGISIGGIFKEFSEKEYKKEVINFEPGYPNIVLDIAHVENAYDNWFDFNLKQSKGNEVKAVIIREAYGASRPEAEKHAMMMKYKITQVDSVITLGSNFEFENGSKYRGQRMSVDLYIPEGKVMLLTYDMRYLMGNTLYRYGYRNSQLGENYWIFQNGKLVCTTCGPEGGKKDSDWHEDISDARKFDFENFNRFNVSGNFKIEYQQAENYSVLASGDQEYLNELVIKQHDDELTIKYSSPGKWDRESDKSPVKIIIYSPKLNQIILKEKASVYAGAIKGEKLEVNLYGASSAECKVDVENLYAMVYDASKLELSGSTNELEAEISQAGILNAYSLATDDAIIKASGASSAKVFVDNNLEVEASGASNVHYRGDARVNIEQSGSSSVTKK